MDKVARAVLRYLFKEYLKSPVTAYSINAITDAYKADPVSVSDYMAELGWIRELWVHQNNLVTCRITVQGIEIVNPLFLRNKLKKLVGALIEGGGRKSLTEIFQHKIEEYSIALDMVYQLEKLGLVNIGHVNENISVELTPIGWKYVDKEGKSLLTLMAVA
jgi:isocitrate dehydrogenase kinase/phosphatase